MTDREYMRRLRPLAEIDARLARRVEWRHVLAALWSAELMDGRELVVREQPSGGYVASLSCGKHDFECRGLFATPEAAQRAAEEAAGVLR